jgi:hypothetical protein
MNLPFSQLPQTAQVSQGSLTDRALFESAHVRRMWSLLSLFCLYATALFVVILLSDGPDIGCILMGIAGHVVYASVKTAKLWREAIWFDRARQRVRERRRRRVSLRAYRRGVV